jgi:PAS domain S-box-containing protein
VQDKRKQEPQVCENSIDGAPLWPGFDEAVFRVLFEGARDAIFWADADSGFIVNCNRAAEELMGMDRSRLIGIHQTRLHPLEEISHHADSFGRAAAGSLRGPFASVIAREDGARVDIEISTSVVTVSGRRLIQGIFRDITERTHALARYRTLFHEMLDGCALHEMIYDAAGVPVDYRFLSVNPAFERLTGLRAEDVVGKTVLEVMPDTEPRWIEMYARVVKTGMSEQCRDYSRALSKHFEVKAFRSDPHRFACVFSDITEHVTAVEALQLSEARLHLAQGAAKAGTWEWDMRSGEVKWAAQLWNLYDLSENTEATLDAFFGAVHPSERAEIQRKWTEAVDHEADLEIEWRVDTRDESERWLLSRGRPIRDDSGELAAYVGIVIEVTEDRQIKNGLTWRRRKVDEAHRVARIGVWEWFLETGQLTWSVDLCDMVGHDPRLPAPTLGELSGYYTVESWDALLTASQSALETGQPYDIELEMIRKDGSMCWTRTVGSVLPDERGSIVGLHGTVHDVTARKLAEQELQRQRRSLAELATDILESGERERRQIAIELHDGVGQALAAAKMTVNQIAADMSPESDTLEIERLLGLLNESISAIRLLTVELSPPVLYELGLRAALGWLADDFFERLGFKCDVNVGAWHREIETHTSVFAFRTIRELLNNAHRHSGVNYARVDVTSRDDMLVIRVEDDGCGFDGTERHTLPHKGAQFGLFSIREGVGLLGGTLEIDSMTGQGTRIDVRLPIDHGEWTTIKSSDARSMSGPQGKLS